MSNEQGANSQKLGSRFLHTNSIVVGSTTTTYLKIFSIFFQKLLDKPFKICYNNSTKRGKETTSMITKRDVKKITDAYYEVQRILSDYHTDMLTKEEIYARLPKDDDGIPFISISALENALRNLLHMRHIECAYVRGVRYFGTVD